MAELDYIPPQRQVVIMRHPQTLSNEQGKFLGQLQSPLSTRGKAQYYKAYDALLAYNPDYIITSPLDRCCSLAQKLSHEIDASCVAYQEFTEMNFGELSNYTYMEALEKNIPLPWGSQSKNWPAKGAESLEEFYERISQAFEIILNARARKILVLTHSGVIRCLLCKILQCHMDAQHSFEIPNVSSLICAIDYQNVILKACGLTPDELKLRYSRKG